MAKDTNIDPSKIKDGNFYDREVIENVLLWISKNKGMDAVREGGRHTAKDLGLFKYLVMWSSMEHIVAKSVALYQELYKYGSLRAWYEKDNLTIEMQDTPNRIREDCVAWLGALIGLAELTHQGRSRGGRMCLQRQRPMHLQDIPQMRTIINPHGHNIPHAR